jgi:ADP-ribose pyrophosphatase YjhB (NUDIX family)
MRKEPLAMKIDPSTQRFSYRVAGVVIHEAKVLCHRVRKGDHWILPGGSCAFGEESTAALTRKFQEELGATISIGRLLWVIENFFTVDGIKTHGLVFVYELALKGESKELTRRDQFLGFEANPRLSEESTAFSLQFRWIPLTSVSTQDVRPAVLKTELLSLPPVTRRLVNHDRG